MAAAVSSKSHSKARPRPPLRRRLRDASGRLADVLATQAECPGSDLAK